MGLKARQPYFTNARRSYQENIVGHLRADPPGAAGNNVYGYLRETAITPRRINTTPNIFE